MTAPRQKGVGMVLVEHDAVKVHQFLVGIDFLVKILVEQPRTVLAIKIAVRRPEKAAFANNLVFEIHGTAPDVLPGRNDTHVP